VATKAARKPAAHGEAAKGAAHVSWPFRPLRRDSPAGQWGYESERSLDCLCAMTRQSGGMQRKLKFCEGSIIRPVHFPSPDSPVVKEILTEASGSSRT
jgi:hypothetical protein